MKIVLSIKVLLNSFRRFLASATLAIVLMVFILICAVTGVTIWRGEEAWRLIFSTLWFNAVLVLLVTNVGFCFFGRIWGRRVSLVSIGMILFHLSFVMVFLGIVYNSLFYFRGTIRLTEGESLQSSDEASYDKIDRGRFFSYSHLKGETTLVKFHRGYQHDGKDKRVAYEIEVGEGGFRQKGIIFSTQNLTNRGFTYYVDQEGYSLLALLANAKGEHLYGAFIPLQSYPLRDGGRHYATGNKKGEAPFAFPQAPQVPVMGLQLALTPSKLDDRSGEVTYIASPLLPDGSDVVNAVINKGKVHIGESFRVQEFVVTPQEVRYWVSMTVRYEPGKPIVLSSLWIGFFGICLTTLARMFKPRKAV